MVVSGRCECDHTSSKAGWAGWASWVLSGDVGNEVKARGVAYGRRVSASLAENGNH